MNGVAFVGSALKQFRDYKELADQTFLQLEAEDFYYRFHEASNSLAVIITHMHGNMVSRWTNFLTEDGEKAWRKRDAEFEEPVCSKDELLALWEQGWQVLFDALASLKEEDLDTIIYIRTKPLTIVEAVHRQLTHYASHVGQIVYVGKMLTGHRWKSLSIAKGASVVFNEQMKKNNS